MIQEIITDPKFYGCLFFALMAIISACVTFRKSFFPKRDVKPHNDLRNDKNKSK